MIAVVVATAFALTASPSRVELAGTGSEVVKVRNRGSARVVLDATRAGFSLDLSGRPRVVVAAPAKWLSVRPKRVAVAPGATVALRVSGRVLRGASPGDHTALLLLATRPARRGGVAVRMRLGIVVVLRAPGRVVHRLAVQSLVAKRGVMRLTVVNRGNVTEQLTGKRVLVTVRRGQRVLARVSPSARELLPRSRGTLVVRVPARFGGVLSVQVAIRASPGGAAAVNRIFRRVRPGSV